MAQQIKKKFIDGVIFTEIDNKIDLGVQGAKDYADAQDLIKLQEGKDYADLKKSEALTYADGKLVEAKSYTDEKLVEAKGYADTQDAAKLLEAKQYADVKKSEALVYADGKLVEAKDYADTQDAAKLVEAKQYADLKKQEAIDTAEAYADVKKSEAIADAHAYADQVKNDLLSGAGPAYDTLKKLEDALKNEDSAIAALTQTVGADLVEAKAYADAAVLVEKTRAEGIEQGLDVRLQAVEAFDLTVQGLIDSAVLVETERAQAEEATFLKLDGSRAMTGTLNMGGGFPMAFSPMAVNIVPVPGVGNMDGQGAYVRFSMFVGIGASIDFIDLQQDNQSFGTCMAGFWTLPVGYTCTDLNVDNAGIMTFTIYTIGQWGTIPGSFNANVSVRTQDVPPPPPPMPGGTYNKIINLADGVDAHDAINKGQLDLEVGNLNATIGVEIARAQSVEQGLEARITVLEGQESNVQNLIDAAVLVEKNRAEGIEQGLDGRIQVLEAKQWKTEKIVLGAGDLVSKELILAPEVGTVFMFVDAIPMCEGVDFTVSGKVLTFAGDLVSGPMALEVGDILLVKYLA